MRPREFSRHLYEGRQLSRLDQPQHRCGPRLMSGMRSMRNSVMALLLVALAFVPSGALAFQAEAPATIDLLAANKAVEAADVGTLEALAIGKMRLQQGTPELESPIEFRLSVARQLLTL